MPVKTAAVRWTCCHPPARKIRLGPVISTASGPGRRPASRRIRLRQRHHNQRLAAEADVVLGLPDRLRRADRSAAARGDLGKGAGRGSWLGVGFELRSGWDIGPPPRAIHRPQVPVRQALSVAAEWYDLTNLMQGLAGSVVGSVVAAIVAIVTVKQTFRAEHEAAREVRRVTAAEAVYAPLHKVLRALGSYRHGVENVYTGEGQEGERLQLSGFLGIAEKVDAFHDAFQLHRPSLRGDTEHQIIPADLALFTLAADIKYVHPGVAPTSSRTLAAQEASQHAIDQLEKYLGDPVPTRRRLERLDRRVAKRERRARRWRSLLEETERDMFAGP